MPVVVAQWSFQKHISTVPPFWSGGWGGASHSTIPHTQTHTNTHTHIQTHTNTHTHTLTHPRTHTLAFQDNQCTHSIQLEIFPCQPEGQTIGRWALNFPNWPYLQPKRPIADFEEFLHARLSRQSGFDAMMSSLSSTDLILKQFCYANDNIT